MVFADRQDIGLMRDTHLHRGRWMVPGVVVYLILCTRIAGGTPRPSCSDHGLRVGLCSQSQSEMRTATTVRYLTWDGAPIGVRCCPSQAVALVSSAEPPWGACLGA
jgi:hypothetical protein